jgi:HEAT repeat protein
LARRLREAGVPLQPIPPELKASLQRTQEGEERARKADLPGLLSLLGEGQSEHKLAALAELHERLYVPFPGEDEGRARPFGPPGSKEAYIPPPPAEVVARRKEAVGPLMARLDDPSPKVREEALRLLGVCGPVAAAAIPKMMEMAKTNADPEPTEIWYAAGEAIGLVADPTDLPRLMRELAAAGGPQTHIAAQALANGRVDFKIAAATITEIAGSKTDNHDWESTIGSLLLLAKYEDAAVEAIFRLAADPVPERRREAIMALDALRGRALPWKGRLETIAAKDSDPKVRQDAEYVLMRLEHAAKRR